MRASQLICIHLGLAFGWQACGATDILLETHVDKLSYAIGMNVGQQCTNRIDIFEEHFITGFKDGIQGKKGALTDQEAKQAMEAINRERRDLRNRRAEGTPLSVTERTKLKEKWSYLVGNQLAGPYRNNGID